MTRFGTLFVLSLFAIAVFTQMNANGKLEAVFGQEEFKFPKNVKAVIDKSCYGCHSENGKSDEAKDALRWDKMKEYDKTKLVSVFDEIIEVVEKEEMPPEKYLEKKPENKPTEEEYTALIKWAEEEADKLLN